MRGKIMDTFITLSVLLPLVAFAAYGVDCLAERFNGYRLSYEAKETLDELSSPNNNKLFRAILKDKDLKKVQRGMRPLIIDNGLKSALADLESEGAKSKTFILMEREIKRFTP